MASSKNTRGDFSGSVLPRALRLLTRSNGLNTLDDSLEPGFFNPLYPKLFCWKFNFVDTDQFSGEYLVWVLYYCSQTDALYPIGYYCDEPAFRISNCQCLAVAGLSQTRQESLIAMAQTNDCTFRQLIRISYELLLHMSFTCFNTVILLCDKPA